MMNSHREPRQAKAAIATGTGSFSIETITVYPPQQDELLVAIKAAGLCHTDFDSMLWGRPIVMGHEGAGIVRATGPGVTKFRPGDAVILN